MSRNDKIKPGQIRFTPVDNRLMAMPPYLNSTPSAMPQWMRMIGKTQGSIRRCAGTIDFLGAGVTLPMWTNLYFRPDGRGSWESKADNFSPPADISSIAGFPYETTGECPMTGIRKIETGMYPKIVNPWRFETARGWSSLILPAYFEPSSDYQVIPSVVHTDFYHLANVVLNITTDKAFQIKYGTPMYQIIPFERKSAIGEIIFNDESDFKYVATTGFGMGHLAPSDGTAGPYRRMKTAVDAEIAEESKGSFLKKLMASFHR